MAILKRNNTLQLNNVTVSKAKVNSNPFSSSRGEPGLMTVVNSKKNGKRVTLNHDVWVVLDRPTHVDVMYAGDYVIFCVGETFHFENITEADLNGTSTKKSKPIIYSSGLVDEIVEKYSLDYSNRVSMTFAKGEVTEYGGKTCVAICINAQGDGNDE